MRSMPCSLNRACVFGPTPHSLLTGLSARYCASVPGATLTRPSGLPSSLPIFATILPLAMPMEIVRDVAAVEKRFVERQAFDRQRVRTENREYRMAGGAILFEVRPHDDQLGTSLQ